MTIPPTPLADRALIASNDASANGDNSPEAFDWISLVAEFMHPMKVAVIEALLYIDRPLSSTDLRKVFDNSLPLGNLVYHVNDLAKKGALVNAGDRKVRGSVESFFKIR